MAFFVRLIFLCVLIKMISEYLMLDYGGTLKKSEDMDMMDINVSKFFPAFHKHE